MTEQAFGLSPGRIVIYARDVETSARFYETHFGYQRSQDPGDRIVELTADGRGVSLLLHPAAKSQKTGQSSVKLVFDVKDVRAFCERSAENGLEFGPVHDAGGYAFANARDPDGNPVSVSSRVFRKGS